MKLCFKNVLAGLGMGAHVLTVCCPCAGRLLSVC